MLNKVENFMAICDHKKVMIHESFEKVVKFYVPTFPVSAEPVTILIIYHNCTTSNKGEKINVRQL